MRRRRMGFGWALIAGLLAVPVQAQKVMEAINRAVVAFKTGSDVTIGWRLFGTEPSDIGFNVYQGSTRLNDAPLTGATQFVHRGAASSLSSTGQPYTVRPVINGQEGSGSESAKVLTQAQPYLSVPIQSPGSQYSANDASVGDVDGDGEYEIILKWDPANSQDNSNEGVTDVVFLDAYTLAGKRLWRIDLGRNIRAGAHYTQFMVYDFDGDGKAEVMCRTSDGSKDGTGKVIGNANADHRSPNGYILKGPEFLTVFEGLTGKELYSTAYVPARGDPCGWGDPNCNTYANRVDRFLAGVAYLDGKRPSAVFCRGYYTRTVLAAWDWDGTKLIQRWVFDSNNPGLTAYTGQGNHQLSVADVDGDGKDEIIYGAMAVDDNGQGLWNSRLHHGDALHVSDFDPSRPGLEVWAPHEGSDNPGGALLSARTGEVYFKLPNQDVGRAVAADISADHPGAEYWGPAGGTRNQSGGAISVQTASTNHLAWWDGDLLRELVDANLVTKANGTRLLEATGCSSNNGTKSNPSLTADLLGDWREEVMWRSSDSRELRIYTTSIPTQYRLYTPMHNPAYRVAVAWQNTAYNQPPHVDYFLGAGMTLPPPKPAIVLNDASVGLGPRRSEGALPPPIGSLVRHDGGPSLRLPFGFTRSDATVLVRNAFGRQVAEARPARGFLEMETALPEGMYFLQMR